MYCNIIYRNKHRPPYMGERQHDYKNEIIVRRCGKDYFKYDTYSNSYVHGFRCRKDLCVKKFYYSKRERLKKDIPENYEEIYENGNGGHLFDIITKKENLKYLQFIGIFVDIYSKGIFVHRRNGLDIIKVLIENLKYFIFLKGFCLVAKYKSIITKKDLLDIINNLSKLSLIENIKIEVADIDLNESEEKDILGCIEGIKINKSEEKNILLELNSEIFDGRFRGIY